MTDSLSKVTLITKQSEVNDAYRDGQSICLCCHLCRRPVGHLKSCARSRVQTVLSLVSGTLVISTHFVLSTLRLPLWYYYTIVLYNIYNIAIIYCIISASLKFALLHVYLNDYRHHNLCVYRPWKILAYINGPAQIHVKWEKFKGGRSSFLYLSKEGNFTKSNSATFIYPARD